MTDAVAHDAAQFRRERVARLAGKLSAGQKRALLGLPVNRNFTPEHTGFQWPTLACLKSKRLINQIRDGLPGCGPDALHCVTPFGKRVREALQNGEQA